MPPFILNVARSSRAGLTFLGPAFSESTLIRYAYDFEQTTGQRKDPPLFPPLPQFSGDDHR